jgi:hypothetical protein
MICKRAKEGGVRAKEGGPMERTPAPWIVATGGCMEAFVISVVSDVDFPPSQFWIVA